MYHFVHAVRGTGFVISRKSVDKTAVHDGQIHIPFSGLDFAYAHIAATFGLCQIDAVFSAGVDLCAVAIRGINQIRSCDFDGLTIRADSTVLACQSDSPAFNGGTVARLGNIPGCVQGHVPKLRILDIVAAALALERQDCHIPRQGSSQFAANDCNVDIPFAGGNSIELDIVRNLAASVLRANGSDMDILDIVLCREGHNLALQGGVVKLCNAARFGADIQRSLVVRIGYIARQVNAAAFIVGAFNIDTALFRSNKPDSDGLGSV